MAVRELGRSPSMVALFARAGVGSIPGASLLPFLGGRGEDVPDFTLVLSEVAIDPDRLAGYVRVCGFDLRDRVPPTYPHMLAFPLQLALMTDSRFPFPAIGLVHIANQIIQHRPITLGERLEIKVSATPVEPHARGRQFSLITEVSSAGELVWEEVSTNLRRGGGDSRRPDAKANATEGRRLTSATELPAAATWNLPGDLGRRYAAVSGDINPIHLHPLTARLFGFPSAIAHGMWTKARCLAAVGPQLPDAFSTRVELRKPIVLPANVTYVERTREDGVDFGVRHATKDISHLDGEVTFTAAPAR